MKELYGKSLDKAHAVVHGAILSHLLRIPLNQDHLVGCAEVTLSKHSRYTKAEQSERQKLVRREIYALDRAGVLTSDGSMYSIAEKHRPEIEVLLRKK